MPVFEDNASRWERNPDGSYSRLPKQKQPPTSLGAVNEAIAANTAAIDELKRKPDSRVERRTGQFLVPSFEYPIIIINDTIHNSGNISRPGGGILVVPKDGLYLMIARISYPKDTGGNLRLCYLRVNGTSIAQDRAVPNAGWTTTTEVTATRFLKAGDNVSMSAYQNSQSTLDVADAQDETTLSVTLLHEGTA